MKEVGIYIHIPFCKSKCLYCDFTSFSNIDEKVDLYIDALKKEISEKLRHEAYKVNSIYFGGGTPSYIKDKHVGDIIEEIKNNSCLDEDVEITLEANPGTLTETKLKKYYEYGINRLSIGLQSANNEILKKIGRIHKYEDFKKSILLAKEVGFNNITSDIIIGLPEQNIYDVEDSINKLIELDIQHISVYSLILEEKTPLYKLFNKGEIKLPDEELERYMYWFSKRKLEEAGFIHYEISNYAKPGFYSKHNLDCWSQEEYLGFGISASSYENGVRYSNKKYLDNYIKNVKNEEYNKNRKIEERQDKQSQMNEFMMLGFRKIVGIDIGEFEKKFGENPLVLYKEKIEKLLLSQLIEYNTEHLRLSKKGIDLANIVFEEFL